jgi:predicted Zn-dependent protease
VTDNDPELTDIYMCINNAYYILSNPDDRAKYDELICVEDILAGEEPKRVARKSTPADDMRLLDAKLIRATREANKLSKSASFWEATRLLERFLGTHPENAQLRKALAAAAVGRKRYHEAVNHMKVACKVEYHDPENYVYLGRIYLMAGQLVLAERALNEALAWNAVHEDALRLKQEIMEVKDADSPALVRTFRKLSRSLNRRRK